MAKRSKNDVDPLKFEEEMMSCSYPIDGCKVKISIDETPLKDVKNIRQLQKRCHDSAKEKGWYDSDRQIPEMIALCHSELSEALEEYRTQEDIAEIYYEDGKPCGFQTELADCVIRILDLCGYVGIDLENAVKEKMAYNATRSYRHGNKKC